MIVMVEKKNQKRKHKTRNRINQIVNFSINFSLTLLNLHGTPGSHIVPHRKRKYWKKRFLNEFV